MPFVRSLSLTRFRNYDEAAIGDLGPSFVVLTGANGAGKTNALEALSLLVPGRGIRHAKIADIGNRSIAGNGWSVVAEVDSSVGPVMVGTGTTAEKPERRAVRVNGADLKSQAELSDYLSAIWLTPQMDGLFLEGSSERRRFFDRMVYAFDPAHAGRITRYENALAERSKLLRDAYERRGQADAQWVSSLEKTIAETGISIAAARIETLHKMQQTQHGLHDIAAHFPIPRLALDGALETWLEDMPALAAEERFEQALASSRDEDAVNGGARVGPHKTDLSVYYEAKNMPAAQSSTGEQKALLTGLVLAHAARLKTARGAAPILLLDEIAAHFDDSRKKGLFDILSGLGGQVWITGTETPVFQALKGADFLVVEDNKITRF